MLTNSSGRVPPSVESVAIARADSEDAPGRVVESMALSEPAHVQLLQSEVRRESWKIDDDQVSKIHAAPNILVPFFADQGTCATIFSCLMSYLLRPSKRAIQDRLSLFWVYF
jgi:hypothetical protein